MRVLLTGATGFIGSRAARHFGDDELHAVVRPGGATSRLAAFAPNATTHFADVFDRTGMQKLIRETDPELAVHVAWCATPGEYLTTPKNLDHLASTLLLARLLADAGCQRLVTVGTCLEYEFASRPLSEASTVSASSLYSACKLAVHDVLSKASHVYGLSFCHLRLFYQYGPWERSGRLVRTVIESLLAGSPAAVTTGAQVRDFLHVDDVGRAIAVAARSSWLGALNVGSGVPRPVREVILAVARACGRPELVRLGAVPVRDDEPAFVCADISNLTSLGWHPRFDLEAGIADTVDWYRAQSR